MSQPQTQQINVPGFQAAVTGLKAEFHVIRHNAKLQKTPMDAGFDLFPSEIDKVTEHGPVSVIWVHTLITIHIAPGHFGLLISRSSSLDRLNGGQVETSVIDCGYTGEWLVRVKAHGPVHTELVKASIVECQKQQIAIAQWVLIPCMLVAPFIPNQPVPSIGGRGNGGFGSTDHRIKP